MNNYISISITESNIIILIQYFFLIRIYLNNLSLISNYYYTLLNFCYSFNSYNNYNKII